MHRRAAENLQAFEEPASIYSENLRFDNETGTDMFLGAPCNEVIIMVIGLLQKQAATDLLRRCGDNTIAYIKNKPRDALLALGAAIIACTSPLGLATSSAYTIARSWHTGWRMADNGLPCYRYIVTGFCGALAFGFADLARVRTPDRAQMESTAVERVLRRAAVGEATITEPYVYHRGNFFNWRTSPHKSAVYGTVKDRKGDFFTIDMHDGMVPKKYRVADRPPAGYGDATPLYRAER